MIHAYLWGNNIFLRFENSDGSNVKFVRGSISGELFMNDIYSEKEITIEYPEAKPCKNLHELCTTWGHR